MHDDAPEVLPDPLLTTTIAAFRLGVSRCSVLRYIHAGKLRVSRYTAHGPFLIRQSEIEKIQRATRRTV